MSKDSIQYYAQELKENTYNLTRMNLVMRGINPSNIFTRNADTLEDDWPIDLDSYRCFEWMRLFPIRRILSIRFLMEKNQILGMLSMELRQRVRLITVQPVKEETEIGNNIFERLTDIPLIDKYNAYQILDDNWSNIAIDFDIIGTEGKDSIKVVDPNMVMKKDKEVQDAFYAKGVAAKLKELKKPENEEERMLKDVLSQYTDLSKEEKGLKKEIKELTSALHLKTKDTIEALSDEQA